MDAEHVGFNETLHQRKLEQFLDQPIESEKISGSVLKRRTPINRANPDEFLWNVVRSQECAEAQEVGCRQALLFDFAKGK